MGQHITKAEYNSLKHFASYKLTVVDNWIYTVPSNRYDAQHEIVKNMDAISDTLAEQWKIYRAQNDSEYCDLFELACEHGTSIQDFVRLTELKPCGVTAKLLEIQIALLNSLIAKGYKANSKPQIDVEAETCFLEYGIEHNPYIPTWFCNGLDMTELCDETYETRLRAVLHMHNAILTPDLFSLICPTCIGVVRDAFQFGHKHTS